MLKWCWLLLTMLNATSALAHDPVDTSKESPWNEWEDWRIVAFNQSGTSVMFIANALTERAGSAVTIELLAVEPLNKEWGTDQEHEHYLVDCDTLSYLRTYTQPFQPSGIFPPPLVRQVPASSAPPTGTILRKALEMGCGITPMRTERIAAPYKWARSHLRQP